MIYRVDIDGTLCNKTYGRYEQAIPFLKNIQKVNKLYDDGHKIILWTARGVLEGLDWREVTETQMKKWGVRYHELSFDKPHFDILFDDKAMKLEEFNYGKENLVEKVGRNDNK